MSKSTTIKEAIKVWEEKHQKVAADATVVKLFMQQPFIVKIEAGLSVLAKCEHLSLGTNQIDRMSNFQGLGCLRILSLSRNNIKKIEGLDAVADTLEELWLSYNLIEKLNGVEMCKKLKILYVSNNKIKAWDGMTSLNSLPVLEDFLASGTPLEEKCTSEGTWVAEVTKRFVQIKKLDGKPLIREDTEESSSKSGNLTA